MDIKARGQFSITVHIILEMGSLTESGSRHPARLAVSEPQASFCLHLPSARITGACNHTDFFTWVLGI